MVEWTPLAVTVTWPAVSDVPSPMIARESPSRVAFTKMPLNAPSPPVIPITSASASMFAATETRTVPPAVMTLWFAIEAVAFASMFASVTAPPTPTAPTAAANPCASASTVESASTVASPTMVKVFRASVAVTSTTGSASATAAFSATTPALTAIERASSETKESAVIRRPPAATEVSSRPIDAFVVLVTLGSASETPAETAPIAPPIASASTLRFVIASTISVPPTLGISAPLSMCAFCVLVSLSTVTCAATPTKPPAPAKPNADVRSKSLARTTRLPPAVMLAGAPTRASVALRMFATSTEAPMPTRPPAAEPTKPVKRSSSSATTRTVPPATMVASIAAEVPRGTVVVSAVAVVPACALPRSLIFFFAPLDESAPVTSRMRLSVRFPEPVEVLFRIDW